MKTVGLKIYSMVLLMMVGYIGFAQKGRMKTNNSSEMNINAAVSGLVQKDGTKASVEKVMSALGLQGLSVAVIENYQIKWTKTWGVKEAGTKNAIDRETAFSTASISKGFTGILIAMLAEKGMIDLDVPVSDYLKRWKLPDNEFTKGKTITLRRLLNHTAGTTQHGFKDFYSGDKTPTLVQVLEGGELPGTKKIDVDLMPGAKWRYSGGGYVIAQIAVEDHLGKAFKDLADQYIIQPLNLKHTTMRQPGEKGFLTNVAKAHNEKGEILGLPICPQLTASGLWSTPTDMALFIIEIQKALRGDKTKVVSPAVAKMVMTELKGGFGLGWAFFVPMGEQPAFSCAGANTGTGGEIIGTRDGGNGITLFGNGPNRIRIPILKQLKDSIARTYGWGTNNSKW